MVWMGVYTKTFLPVVSQANARILEQSRSGLELRVDKQGVRQAAELREFANGQ
jgi:hypothetical protein